MASKKLKKLLAAGLAGYAGAKMLGAGAKGSTAANVDSGRGGKSASAMARKAANIKKPVYKDAIMRGAAGTKAGSSGSSYADVLGRYDDFGLGAMDGAKAGKMIKAKNGVMAKGCKLGRNKRTIIT